MKRMPLFIMFLMVPLFFISLILGTVGGIVIVTVYVITGMLGLVDLSWEWGYRLGKKIIDKLFP